MRVLLTISPVSGGLTLEKAEDVAHGMGIYPPLGILYIASFLKANSSHSVLIVDPEAERSTLDQLEQVIRAFKPDIFGITTFTNTLKNVVDRIRMVKTIAPGCITVMGGPHVALYPAESLHFPEVDYAIVGDGEESFLRLVNTLSAGRGKDRLESELMKIDGIVLRKMDGELFTGGFARILDLDKLPFPDISLVNKECYYCILGKNHLMSTIATSRGCPFRCTFCNSPDKKYRLRSAKSVVEEMEYLANNGIEEIFFFDDLFNISKKRVLEVCDEIIRRKLDRRVRWAFRGRVDSLVDEDVVARLKAAGCERAQLGIEKATDEALARIKKGITIEQIRAAVNNLHRHNILSVGNFILFTPGENEEDAEQIIRFSLSLAIDHAEYHVFAPYPGSEIYDEGLVNGLFKRDYWREYALNPYQEFPLQWEEMVKRDRMFEIANAAYRRFYYRPRVIWNELRRVTSWTELCRKCAGAMTVLRMNRTH